MRCSLSRRQCPLTRVPESVTAFQWGLAAMTDMVSFLSMRESIELLVTVKAYPNISQKYGEVVCVAGVRTDVQPRRWVRLFPIAYRDLGFSERFKKYQYISLDAEPHSGDARPESMRPNTNSLNLGNLVDTRKGWAVRRSIIEPLTIDSMCELQRRQAMDGTSLGVFRPAEVSEFTVETVEADWDPDKQAVVDQPSLLMPTKNGLERIPFRFRYRYRCSDPRCRGHHQSIIDWELSQAYRDWRGRYGNQVLEMLRHKWLDEMCGEKKDTAFFVGNQHQHPDAFLVLGVFWPPKA